MSDMIVNPNGEAIAVLKKELVGVDPVTGEEIYAESIDEAATAELNKPEAKRERAYMAEADPIADRARDYDLEANACRLDGDSEGAAVAQAKADAAKMEYLAKKREIRSRYPDDGADF